MLETGTQAPEFTLPDKDGNEKSLSDFRGKKVVLYFYSKDNTSGCTRQAQAFAALYDEFKEVGAEVIGISKDSAASHARFAEKNSLPFVLLADPERKAIEAYGVWQEKKLYGKVSMGVVRTTFIIDENGVILKIMPKVKPDANAADALDFLKGLTNAKAQPADNQEIIHSIKNRPDGWQSIVIHRDFFVCGNCLTRE